MGRGTATARGCLYVIREIFRRMRRDLRGATAAVQGFGNAGSFTAQYLHQDGVSIVAVSDSRGGVMSRKGIDPAEAMRHKEETGTIVGLAGTETISRPSTPA